MNETGEASARQDLCHLGPWSEHTQAPPRFLGSEECGLVFNTSPTHRVALVEKCYIGEGFERRLANP